MQVMLEKVCVYGHSFNKCDLLLSTASFQMHKFYSHEKTVETVQSQQKSSNTCK